MTAVGMEWLSTQADHYTREIWRAEQGCQVERRIWLAVMRAQVPYGLVHEVDVEAAEEVVRQRRVNLKRINERERVTRHDLKARLEEFAYLCRHERAHLGLTSADLVENVTLWRMRQTALLLGFDEVARQVRLRGIKGAMGTQQDMIDLVGEEGAARVESAVVDELSWDPDMVMRSIGQVGYRSADLLWATGMIQCASRSSLAPEWWPVLRGFLNMITQYDGDQWNEGDVSSSVVRRVALPGIALAVSAGLKSQTKEKSSE